MTKKKAARPRRAAPAPDPDDVEADRLYRELERMTPEQRRAHAAQLRAGPHFAAAATSAEPLGEASPLAPAEFEQLRSVMGKRVRKARETLRMTQRELGERCGRTDAWVRHVEAGRAWAPPDLILFLARQTEPTHGWHAGWFFGYPSVEFDRRTDEEFAAQDRERVAARAAEVARRRAEDARDDVDVLTATDRLDVSVRKVWELLAEGHLQARRANNRTRVTIASIEAFKATPAYAKLRRSGPKRRGPTMREHIESAVSRVFAGHSAVDSSAVARVLEAIDRELDALPGIEAVDRELESP